MLKVNDINVYYGAIHAIKGHHLADGLRSAPLPHRLH